MAQLSQIFEGFIRPITGEGGEVYHYLNVVESDAKTRTALKSDKTEVLLNWYNQLGIIGEIIDIIEDKIDMLGL